MPNDLNPATWSKNHKLALGLSALIGLVAGVVVGYLVYATGSGADGAVSFGYWVDHPIRRGGLWWGLIGAAIGAAVVYVKRHSAR
jgi:hypothetical protein